MDRKELNQDNIEIGKRVLMGLDSDLFPVTAAFWLLDTEALRWKYIVATPVLDEIGPLETYRKFFVELRKIMDPDNAFSKAVSVVSPSHPLIRLLRGAINTGRDSVSGIRFTGNAINNQYIEDVYLYRIS